MENIKEQLENVEIGKIQKYKNLAIAPILGSDSGLEHLALSDALEEGLVITEKGYESNSSPHGSIEIPFKPLSVALAAGAIFVFRWYEVDI